MCLLSGACVYLGDASRAAILHRLLSPFAALNAFAQPELAVGSVSHALGRLAAALGRYDEAVSHFETALETNARMGGRPWLAHAQYDYAHMLLERGEPGDSERAAGLIASSKTLADEIGLITLAGRISES